MESNARRAVAIVGLGAMLPDAANVGDFWQNLCAKRYSIIEVPPNRWSIANYYDPDPKAPEKTYSKIGGWVRGFSFDSTKYRIPPRVAAAMDESQQWAVAIAAQALADYGYPDRPLDGERTGVVMGNAMGGELHYLTYMRIAFPEYAAALQSVGEFSELPAGVRDSILAGMYRHVAERFPPVTEDAMPGELANIVSGRVANVFNLRGPNFITDAACASSFAAVAAAIDLLARGECDAVLTGGVDRNMGASTFVKFSKIGALSATGTRPFADGADGFVMGEGAAAFLLKRLADAERDGDHIYAVIRGVGGSSDGRGKGITAPNPQGQQLAIRRAWDNAGLDPVTATLIEAHGTSTPVGDVAEVESLAKVFGGAPSGQIALGSVKSNIGHLKAGAGAAGLLKTVLALCNQTLPPTLNAEHPNPNIDFPGTPFYLNTELRPWERPAVGMRRAGVSAYGFGGTNFHVVVEEHVPGILTEERSYRSAAVDGPSERTGGNHESSPAYPQLSGTKPPLRGILALGAGDQAGLAARLSDAIQRVQGGWAPPLQAPAAAELIATERLVIDFGDREELLGRLDKAQRALAMNVPAAWKALSAQGIFRGSGPRPCKTAFLFPGQGSQYLNMGRALAAREPVVADIFADADRVMEPILGKPLSDFIFVDSQDPEAVRQAEMGLMQTAITQPAMLAMDTAIYRLLAEYGFGPDVVMGHSLGEYGALIAAGVLPFEDALEAVAARGREMSRVSWEDNGWMAAVMAPPEVIEGTLAGIDGYVVAANINSRAQCVIGGESKAVEQAIGLFQQAGYDARRIPVSHAFHTKIVAPASKPLRAVLDRLRVSPARLPVISNVTGDFYREGVEAIKDALELQVASPVQWVKGLETLFAAGVRCFVEVGPKKALKGFTDDLLGDREDVVSLFTNHPKTGEVESFNQALCGLYAAGYLGQAGEIPATIQAKPIEERKIMEKTTTPVNGSGNGVADPALGQALLQAIRQLAGEPGPTAEAHPANQPAARPHDRNEVPLGSLVVTGTGLGLPGTNKSVMDPDNVMRILRGEQFVDLIPERFRMRMVKKHVTRVRKSEDGSGSFEFIDNPDEVIRLAGRQGYFNLAEEYGVPEKLIEALDITTQLAMAAGLDALREAGIPLVQTYKLTTTGKYLPERWLLPEALRDETGIIFASAFPGGDRLTQEIERYYEYENRAQQLAALEELRQVTNDDGTLMEIQRRMAEIREVLDRDPYVFDRRFLFRILSMGHSQFAEYVGARGPNTQVNAACASTAQAISIAEDWIRSGRCRRVVVIAADDATGDHLIDWIGAGFLASGAAATDDRVAEAALPFDKRRHGTIMGMGACALVVESEDAVRERGMRGIVELLSSETANSAFHGTRLDVDHISQVMNNLVTAAELRFGINRYHMAGQTVFMSHETFTPARGGSASAEVAALRQTFGATAGEIVIANTKGFIGHPMGVGVEDVIAVKILEYGIVPPVPNFKEVDPELGLLNLSRGGRYPVQYAIHLAAGFGSQIAMTLTRRIPGSPDRMDSPARYRRWLADVSGDDRAETEVVKRVLRVKANGEPGRAPIASTWRYGTGPVMRANVPAPGADRRGAVQPAAGPADIYREFPAQRGPAPAPVPTNGQAVAPDSVPVVAAPAPVVMPAPAPQPVVPQALAVQAPAVEGPAAPVQAPEAPAPGVLPIDPVAERVLGIVAEKTGYPQDMLDPELDLEADLGVDTVKQAETFAAIRQAFDIPAQDNLRLRDYPTLARVIGFVREMRPDLGTGVPVAPAPASAGPQPAVVSPTPAPIAPVDQAASTDPIADQVMAIVAEKTGYPQDMLDPELDLEADLGVDTVKQAETFVAVRQAFNIPAQENLKLRDYPTLARVIDFVREMRPDLAPDAAAAPQVAAPPAPAPAEPAPATGPAIDPVAERVLEIVAEKTGYPKEMLEPDLDLEADLGVDTVKQAETFVAIRQAFDIPTQENLKLRDYPTLGRVIGFVHEMRPDLRAAGRPAPVVPTAAGEPAQPAPAAQPSTTTTSDPVAEQVLAIVAEKTGYPQEMLDLDLDLEADLGVDTVKQAETFVAIRQAFDIPKQDDLRLRDYPTLARVIGFVHERRPDLVSGPATTEPTPAPPAAPAAHAAVERPRAGSLEDADRIPRRVPLPVVRPALELCKATGVQLGQGSRVVVMADQGGAGRELINRLKARGVTVLAVEGPATQDALSELARNWLADGPVQGVYWLPALDVESDLEQLDLPGWRSAVGARVKNLYSLMRALYESIATPETFLVSATRLGGWHGYASPAAPDEPAGATAPLGGAVTGFTKAYKRERPQALVKAVDFADGGLQPGDIAEALISETLFDPGIVEVGQRDGVRYTVGLEEQPAADGNAGLALGPASVFLVTGAAGGITSAITADLAAASGGIFYLLDLVPAPARDDELVALFRTDREALKQKLIEAAKAAGERPTPVKIDKQILAIERSEAALRAIEAVEAAGGQAHYHSVNLLDDQGVSAVIEEIRQQQGRLDVLVHAGGLEISRSLPDKDPKEFDLVFDVKAEGFYNLLHAARDLPIGATVAFSSVAGRFGNSGQTDYSAANDLLCKITSSLRRWRPATRGIVIDWTAWGGIGMATRGSIPKIMEMAGIDMLPPESGVPTVRRELTAGGRRGELVVGQRLGILAQEWDEAGGLDVARANEQLAARRLPVAGQVKAARLYGELEIETTLDPKTEPFLHDHQMEGTALLPGVVGMEAFAELAAVVAPGYRVAAIENAQFLSPFKFYRQQPRTLYLSARALPAENGVLVAHTTLKSITQPASGDRALPPQVKVHFSADVRLTCQPTGDVKAKSKPPARKALDIPAEAIYRVYFHGPAYRVLEQGGVQGDRAVGLLAQALPPDTATGEGEWLMAPRLVELCFQTAGLWQIKTQNVMALPMGVRSVSVYKQLHEAGDQRLYALIAARDGGASFDAQVVDKTGTVYVDLQGYTTVQLPGTVQL